MGDYLTALLMFGGIYALLGLGLNLQWGHTGLVNLGFVAFFAVGAYASALLAGDLSRQVSVEIGSRSAHPGNSPPRLLHLLRG